MVAHGGQRDAEAAAVLLRDRPLDQRRRPLPRARMRRSIELPRAGDVEEQRLARGGRTRRGSAPTPPTFTEDDSARRTSGSAGAALRARDEEVLRHLVLRAEVVDRLVAQAVGAGGQRRQVELRLALRVVRQRARRLLGAVLPVAQPLLDGIARRPARAQQVARGLDSLPALRAARAVSLVGPPFSDCLEGIGGEQGLLGRHEAEQPPRALPGARRAVEIGPARSSLRLALLSF